MDLTRHERHELAEIERALQREAPELAALVDGWGLSAAPPTRPAGVLRRLLRWPRR